jgi:hypothetical protein
MANRLISLTCVLLTVAIVISCKKAPEKATDPAPQASNDAQQPDGRFHSHFGSTIACPADWKATDNGETWTLKSPDHNATISIWTFPVQGSGTMQDFQNTMTNSITKEGTWKSSEWTSMDIGGTPGMKRTFDPQEGNPQLPCRAYLLQTGNFYSAILLRVSDEAMTSNGEFYEGLIRSFHGPTQGKS